MEEASQVSPTLIVGVIFVLAFVSRWLWDYNRAKREESAEHEPKANPPLHQQFVERPDYDRDRQELKEELGRHARMRKEIYQMQESHGREISALKVQTDTLVRQNAALDGKIDDLPERIMNLVNLKNS